MNEVKKYTEKVFEDIKYIDENGVEYWHARKLTSLLEYSKWENFNNLIIENGSIDNKVEFIHVLNPNNKNVSFKTSYILGSNYNSLDVNISY